MSDAVTRLAAVQARVGGKARLVAVSKTFAADEIEPVLKAGQRIFGENRVQEAQGKWPGLRAQYPDVELHLIGPLQSNKAAEAVKLFDVIQTIDRPKIAGAVAKEMARQSKAVQCFVQVNTGSEPQKAGVLPQDADQFLKSCPVPVIGLMCIPPVGEDPRPHFRMLKEIAARHGLKELSMGMSGDFQIAIEEGATIVRVGSAIFGSRPAAGH